MLLCSLSRLMTLDGKDKNGQVMDEESDYGEDLVIEESEPDDSGE